MAKKADRIVLSKDAQYQVVQYLRTILQAKRNFSSWITRLNAIDVAYYCYKAIQNKELPTELDINNIVKADDVNIPLIVSQVDSLKAYYADVFLSGMPMFPVAASAEHSELAEAFEAILDAHAVRGRYARELLLVFTNAAKYNFAGLETAWGALPPFIPDFSAQADLQAATAFYLTRLRALDPYNTLIDFRVSPADTPYVAEYVGDVQLISRNYLKRIINDLSRRGMHMNVRNAFNNLRLKYEDGKLAFEKPNDTQTNPNISPQYSVTYVLKPQVSQYLHSAIFRAGGTWEDYIRSGDFKRAPSPYPNLSNMYELATVYARIIPSEYGISAPNKNTPQIWRFRLINGHTLISAEPVQTPHDIMPVLVTQPNEDHFAYQTHSVAEGQLPMQRAATDLYNVFLASAKRAINDRMLYDPTMIASRDINSNVPAAKIPVRGLGFGKTMSDAVKPLPFEANATANSMAYMQGTLQLSYMLTGLNPFRQGMTQKGNRTMEEFNSIMAFSDMRTRTHALAMEMQLFTPLKEILKFNILMHQDSVISAVSPLTGKLVQVKKSDLLTAGIEFKVADGFTPKSKLMSTDDLQVAFTFLAQMPQIGQEYDLGKMFAHLMSLRGVKNLQQYRLSDAEIQQRAAQAAQQGNQQNAAANTQTGGNKQ